MNEQNRHCSGSKRTSKLSFSKSVSETLKLPAKAVDPSKRSVDLRTDLLMVGEHVYGKSVAMAR